MSNGVEFCTPAAVSQTAMAANVMLPLLHDFCLPAAVSVPLSAYAIKIQMHSCNCLAAHIGVVTCTMQTASIHGIACV